MLKRFVVLLLTSSSVLLAQGDFKKSENIDYVGKGNPRQTLDRYLPEVEVKKPLPVILWIHGGAWLQGSKKNPRRALQAKLFGPCAVVSINYRLTQEAHWPAQINDCKAAVRWVHANAKTHNLDSERIVAWGTSAGGHLVSMLGTTQKDGALDGKLGPHTDQSTHVKAVINFFGPTDLSIMDNQGSAMNHNASNSPEGKLLGGTVSEHVEKAKSASPFHHISKGDAPFLTVHGTNDRLVPYKQGSAFDQKLDKVQVPSILLTVEGGGHGKGFGLSVQTAVTAFLNDHFFGKKHDLHDSAVKKDQ